ncbi:MAG: M6 family metalloprotease domain-containing protein [Prevotella sp.]|nr:M6 family metalloprotease domain-containing protein [Prevotella sp.]MBQ9203636.1 M6 family metalloprotease domain-containing protein [Prevotella sp.]
MKKLLSCMLMMMLTTVNGWSARALSEPFTVRQPDGTELTITLYGDEHASWQTTADGMLVVETADGYRLAAINDRGELSATALLAHDKTLRNAEEQQACLLQQQRQHLFFDRTTQIMQTARRAQVTGTGYLPHEGSPKCLVILANFSDNSFASTDPVAQFQQYFNGETQENLGNNEQNNIVSVRKYFEQSSHGKFTPQFDIVGPITLPETMEYYGKDTGDAGSDAHFSQFCKDAIAAVDDLVDFHDYDNRGDGKAELVCVIYAGYGQSVSGNPANTIWPKCGLQNVQTKDGVQVTYMNCSPELYRVSRGNNINGIGLFTHEFSHGMGLPDLYATAASARVNNQTPEFWDLMDYGEYEDSGYAPVPYTAWEQSVMGWIDVEELSTSQANIELKSLVQDGKAYKFGNGGNAEEWMMVENAQYYDKTNHTIGFGKGHGLLVWHIAYRSNTVNMGDYPNNTKEVPRVCIVPADGLVINGYLVNNGYSQAEYMNSLAGDPFPGTSQVSMLTAGQSLPNFKFYNGDETPVASLKNIKEDTTTGVVTFDFDSGTTTIIDIMDNSRGKDNNYYTLDGRQIQGQPVNSGLYIHGGKIYRK